MPCSFRGQVGTVQGRGGPKVWGVVVLNMLGAEGAV
jgi:hypothetical protein